MSVIYLLISISIVVAIAFFIAFVVAVKTGQYDDDYTPSVRMLFDDELLKTKKTTTDDSIINKETKVNKDLNN
ncbi:cbb3-type cytochrome oxidase assembly protein CcoS [Flavobacterium ovatum]|uniref:cbb3-type cytochrome oxidase assembly protein CcoS n=1 Tax=Flavobacterium ovatum TaxID=1928857 RepID=UPI00344D4F82